MLKEIKKSEWLQMTSSWCSLRERCPNTEFFLVLISRIRTEYGDLPSKSPYSVRIGENTDQMKLRICTLFTQWSLSLTLDKFHILSWCFSYGLWTSKFHLVKKYYPVDVNFFKSSNVNIRTMREICSKSFSKVDRATLVNSFWSLSVNSENIALFSLLTLNK